jgi:hypothetical protein
MASTDYVKFDGAPSALAGEPVVVGGAAGEASRPTRLVRTLSRNGSCPPLNGGKFAHGL